MLVDFSFKNVGSFKNTQNFTMLRDTSLELEKASIVGNFLPNEGLNRVSAFYGANASGKTIFLEAIMALSQFVVLGRVEDISFVNHKDDSAFRIIYIYNNKKYDYSIASDGERVKHEKLNIYHSNQPTLIFEYSSEPRDIKFGSMISREEATAIDYNSQKEPNRPVLHLLKDSDVEDIKDAFSFFKKGIVGKEMPTLTSKSVERRLRKMVEKDPKVREFCNQILPSADFGIKNVALIDEHLGLNDKELSILTNTFIELSEVNGKHLDENAKQKLRENISNDIKRASFTHAIQNDLVNMDFSDESSGTVMASSIFLDLKKVLDDGAVFVVDEIDCSIHPTLVVQLINVFNHEETNPKGAQLIFTTHDVSILDSSIYGENILDRDQVWFVEKNDAGESSLYPLTQIGGVRKDDNLYRKYIVGRYGAVPKVSLFYEIKKYWEDKKDE